MQCAFSQGWRARELHEHAGKFPQCHDLALEDHVQPGYFRKAQTAGRPPRLFQVQQPQFFVAGGDYPYKQWLRERDPTHLDPDQAAPPGRLGHGARLVGGTAGYGRKVAWPGARKRSDRLGQDHHPALGAGPPQHPRSKNIDRGRPDRNHPGWTKPGANQQQDRLDVRRCPAQFSARRSRRDHGRRDA